MSPRLDRKSTRLNSSHTVIYTLSLHDALPICDKLLSLHPVTFEYKEDLDPKAIPQFGLVAEDVAKVRSEEHTSELQSHSDLHSFPTRRSSDLRQATVTSSSYIRIQRGLRSKSYSTVWLSRRRCRQG